MNDRKASGCRRNLLPQMQQENFILLMICLFIYEVARVAKIDVSGRV